MCFYVDLEWDHQCCLYGWLNWCRVFVLVALAFMGEVACCWSGIWEVAASCRNLLFPGGVGKCEAFLGCSVVRRERTSAAESESNLGVGE